MGFVSISGLVINSSERHTPLWKVVLCCDQNNQPDDKGLIIILESPDRGTLMPKQLRRQVAELLPICGNL